MSNGRTSRSVIYKHSHHSRPQKLVYFISRTQHSHHSRGPRPQKLVYFISHTQALPPLTASKTSVFHFAPSPNTMQPSNRVYFGSIIATPSHKPPKAGCGAGRVAALRSERSHKVEGSLWCRLLHRKFSAPRVVGEESRLGSQNFLCASWLGVLFEA